MKTTTSILSALLLLVLFATESGGQTFIRTFPDSDVGPSVLGVASANTLYVSGLFENLLVHDGVGIVVSTAGAQTSSRQYGNKVYTSIPDGSGGFFVAGEFPWVDDDLRSRIARLNSDGTLNTTFNPSVINGPVRALALVGGNLIAGGEFTTVNGVTHNRIARFNATTGVVDAAFTIAVTGGAAPKVLTIDANDAGTALFIGGDFTTVDGTARSNIARINLSPLALNTTYTAGTNGTVNAIRVSSNNNNLYIGGNFTTVGVKNRTSIAKVDAADGIAITGWNADANGAVHDIELITDGIIACGEFTQIGGKSRSRMAKMETSDGTVRNGFVIGGAGVNNTIYSITEAETGSNDWFIAGAFTSVASTTRNFLAKVDGTGDLMTWNPGSATFTEMRTVAFDPAFASSGIFCGGRDDASIASAHIGKIVNNVAVFPEISNTSPPYTTGFAFRDVSGNNTGLGVGPDATFFNGGVNRGHFAEWTVGGNMTSTQFRPVFGTGGKFWDIVLDGTTAIVVGEFSQLERHDGTTWGGTVTRNNIAAIDLAAAPIAFTAFNPNANGVIYDVVRSGGTIFVAGNFTQIGGVSRAGVAAIDLATGNVTAWNPAPSPSGSVNAIAVSGDGATIFLGGSFTSAGGSSRSNIAAVDNTNGTALSWNPGTNGNVYALTVDGGNLYVGGGFTTVAGSTRNRAAVVSTTTGALDGWNPNLDNAVFDIAIFNNQVVLVGSFTTILSRPRNGLAAVTRAPGGAPKSVSLRTGAARGSTAAITAMPNPMRGSAAIEFTVPQGGRTVIDLYSSLGAKVREIFADDLEEGGRYSIGLERSGLPSGVYLLRMMNGGEQRVERIVIAE